MRNLVEEKAVEFAHALANSREVREFRESQEQMMKDTEAVKLLDKLQAKTRELTEKQMYGTQTQEDVREYQRFQLRMLRYPVVGRYYQSQQDLDKLVKATQDIIAKKLGISFDSGGSC